MKHHNSFIWKKRFCTFLFLSLFGFSAIAQVNPTDSLALVSLYNSTNGPAWANNTNWLSNEPINTWHGVQVANNRVSALFLFSNNLDGTLPNEIGDLTAIRTIYLNSNKLVGNLPSSIGNLSILVEINIISNQLTGPIPTTIKSLSGLVYASFSSNQFTGNLPPEIGRLPNLVVLEMKNNQFVGQIPDFEQAVNLQYLDLRDNQFGGELPPGLFRPALLRQVLLTNNNIGGMLPEMMGDAVNLEGLFLKNNEIGGGIPVTVGGMAGLKVLDLSENNLNLPLPEELGDLTELVNLFLNDNDIPGSIPAGMMDVGDLPKLTDLLLQNNELVGNIPSTVGNLSALKKLRVEFNELSGTLPASLGQLTQLNFLTANDNKLTGQVPAQLATATALRYLFLNNNQIVDLPDLMPLNNLLSVAVENNLLTFEDLEPNVGLAPSFNYAPQPPVNQAETIVTAIGNVETLTVVTAGANNVYQWTLNGVDIPTAIAATLEVNVDADSYGVYECKVTNKDVENLTIMRRPIILTEVPLPIELLSFEAKVVGTAVKLDWVTEIEYNNDYFTLERSNDGVDFRPIATIQGNGTTTSKSFYNHIDERPYFGVSYYRLLAHDYDGTVTNSDVETVEIEKEYVNQIFPNPIKSGNTMTLRGNLQGDIQIRLMDVAGLAVYETTIITQDGKNIEFTPENIVPGIYLLVLDSGIKRLTRKVIFF